MPVVRDVAMGLTAREVLRHKQAKKYTKASPALKDTFVELVHRVQEERLLEPAIAYQVHSLSDVLHEERRGGGNAPRRSAIWWPLPPGGDPFAAVVCTIGPRLEEEASDYFENRRFGHALLLDSIGDIALEALVRQAHWLVSCEAAASALVVEDTPRSTVLGSCKPGEWHPLSLAAGEQIGVTVSARGLVFPRKSACTLVDLQVQATSWPQAEAVLARGRKEEPVVGSPG